MPEYDAVVVGAGPNGLAAAIELARGGLTTCLLEAQEAVGGGTRSAELSPGLIYDVCSAIHPLAAASPFMKTLPLEAHGLEWIHPPIPLAHPLDEGKAVCLHRNLVDTAENLLGDAKGYQSLMGPLTTNWDALGEEILSPLHFPRHALLMARFARRGLRSLIGLADDFLKGREARALFAGLGAHSFLPLNKPPSAAFGLVLGALSHVVGWPFPRRGSQMIANSMAKYFEKLGGTIKTSFRVSSWHQLPSARVFLFDLTPRQLLEIAGDRFSLLYRWRLRRFRHGPGVFKLDLVVTGPIPWQAQECRRAGTVHLGGTLEEIASAEEKVFRGDCPESPFVLLAQQSLFDSSRVRDGKQVVWAYTHVPNRSNVDMSERIEAQIERFAPGFRKTILQRKKTFPRDLEGRNPNMVGGDINGGLADLGQLLTRPVARLVPYATSAKNIFICSSSTPPGGGVHGMCGYFAARAARRHLRS